MAILALVGVGIARKQTKKQTKSSNGQIVYTSQNKSKQIVSMYVLMHIYINSYIWRYITVLFIKNYPS